MFCVYCGAENSSAEVLCKKCGKKLLRPVWPGEEANTLWWFASVRTYGTMCWLLHVLKSHGLSRERTRALRHNAYANMLSLTCVDVVYALVLIFLVFV
jgi:hypothetical protein